MKKHLLATQSISIAAFLILFHLVGVGQQNNLVMYAGNKGKEALYGKAL